MQLVGEAVEIGKGDQGWEAGFVAGPQMWKQNGRYYLFFQGNENESVNRGVGYARCESAVGPCTDAPENPLLKSRQDTKPPVLSPGGPAIVQTKDGATWMLYHVGQLATSGSGSRSLWLDRLVWIDGKPTLAGPTNAPQSLR